MSRRLAVTCVATAALAVAAGASAGRTEHGTFTDSGHFVDTQGCAFPVVGDFEYTNDNSAVFDAQGQIKGVVIHQHLVIAFSANGVTLRENDRWNVQVDFVAGESVQSKHVGITFHLIGPNGTIVRAAGQIVYEVVDGFDGPIVAVHGPALAGDAFTQADFCAAFS